MGNDPALRRQLQRHRLLMLAVVGGLSSTTPHVQAGHQSRRELRDRYHTKLPRDLRQHYDRARSSPIDFNGTSIGELRALALLQQATGTALEQIRYRPGKMQEALQRWLRDLPEWRPARVAPIFEGRGGSRLFRVDSGRRQAVLKIFPKVEDMVREVAAIDALAVLGLDRVESVRLIRPFAAVQWNGERRFRAGAMFSHAAGDSLWTLIARAAKASGAAVEPAFERLRRGVRVAGRGLAEVHEKGRRGVSRRRDRVTDMRWVVARWRSLRQSRSFTPEQVAAIDHGIAVLRRPFIELELPATVAHGDAILANLFVRPGRLQLIDIETVMRSVMGDRRYQTGAVDLGRALEDLANQGERFGLAAERIATVQQDIFHSYCAGGGGGIPADVLREAVRPFQVHLALLVLGSDLADAEQRDGGPVDAERLPAFRRLVRYLQVAPPGGTPHTEKLCFPSSGSSAARQRKSDSRGV